MARPDRRPPFVDRPAARWLALSVIALCVVALGYWHRDDLFPITVETSALDEPAIACINQRFAEIDVMVDEGSIETPQADLFRRRAEAMCRQIAGGDNPAGRTVD